MIQQSMIELFHSQNAYSGSNVVSRFRKPSYARMYSLATTVCDERPGDAETD